MRAFVTIAAAVVMATFAVAEPTVQVRVASETIRVNEPFRIQVSILGERHNRIEVPRSDEIEIYADPISHSQRVSMVNGQVSTSVEYVLQAVASVEGDLEIESFSIHYDGGVVQSEPVSISVLPPNAPTPRNDTPDEQMRTDDWEEFVWVTSEVDKRAAYVGESITLTLTHWEIQHPDIRIIPNGPTAYRPPSTNGFYRVDADEVQEMTEYRSLPYRKKIKTHVLYPTTTGNLTIGEWQWQGRGAHMRASFFGRQRNGGIHDYVLETPAIPILVKPLPPAPPEFSGAVGDFTMRVSIDPPSVVVGQPARLTVTISGKGNPEIIGAPVIPELENAFVSGPEAHVLALSPNDPTQVDKAFVWQIIPKRAENIEIPALDFTYFDPGAETYASLGDSPVTLGVVAAPEGLERVMADGGVSDTDGHTSVKLYSDALAPNVRDAGAIYAAQSNRTLFAFSLASPAFAYLVFAGFLLRRRHLSSNSAVARAHYAYSRGKKRLAMLEGHRQDIDGLHQVIRGYIADRIGVPEGGVTSHDAESLLAEAGVEHELADATVRTLRACERAAYASQAISADEYKALYNSAATNMERLERVLKDRPVR